MDVTSQSKEKYIQIHSQPQRHLSLSNFTRSDSKYKSE